MTRALSFWTVIFIEESFQTYLDIDFNPVRIYRRKIKAKLNG